MSKTLHEIIGKDKVGYPMAQRSDNKWVFEVVGTGEILFLEKSEFQKIMPYTIDVKFGPGTGIYGFKVADKGSVKVGDVIIRTDPMANRDAERRHGSGYAIVQVVEVDTKNTSASCTLEGYNITQQKLLAKAQK